jgi:HlyD family secretion protein
MKHKLLFISVPLCIVLIVLGVIIFMPHNHDYKADLRFTKIEKGNLRITVSCTGTINPQGVVQVGTQVSGTISKVYVDFNDTVKKNQVLAVLDTTLLEIAVAQAQAQLAKADAQYKLDLTNYENNKSFHDQKLISDYDFESIRVAKESSYVAKLSAEADLKRARANLSYAIIRSPIDGTVINRNVEQGQTVAASFSTPTLFTIANDLSNMQIDALVDENDIGKIKVNQKAEFSVEAYPDQTFEGVVTQVRLEPVTVSNVVNYYVIIKAKNEKHLLLPGMTATIDIIIDEKNDVLLVANSALRFRPAAEMLADMNRNRSHAGSGGAAPKGAAGTESANVTSGPAGTTGTGGAPTARGTTGTGGAPTAAGGRSPDRRAGGNAYKNQPRLWFLDKNGDPGFIPVRTGLTDGQKTELLPGPGLLPGLEVISGSAAAAPAEQNNNRGGQGGGMRPPRLF